MAQLQHPDARVILVSRQGCHLCDEAAATIAEACAEGQWASVDVDEHPDLRQRYSDHVPVVFVDGRLLAYWTLTREQLDRALAGEPWPAPPGL